MSDWKTLKDTLGLTLRPIDVWPKALRQSWQREGSPFSAPLKDTLRILKYELECLRATDIVLQIAIRPGDLRLDGLPRAGAIAEHPGVILSFKTPSGHRRRAFDRFRRWEHNLRALASNLYDLRHANLYGVEEDSEQYRGWTALPAPPAEDAPFTVQSARDFLAEHSGYTSAYLKTLHPDDVRLAYRVAAARLHPDTDGGDTRLFQRLQEAKEVLDKHNAGRTAG